MECDLSFFLRPALKGKDGCFFDAPWRDGGEGRKCGKPGLMDCTWAGHKMRPKENQDYEKTCFFEYGQSGDQKKAGSGLRGGFFYSFFAGVCYFVCVASKQADSMDY